MPYKDIEKQLKAQRESYARHREARNATSRLYRKNNREKVKEFKLKLRYGITKRYFDESLERQGNVCAVCRKPDWGKRGPCVDHDPITGNVRGILCWKCNVAIALIDDNIEIAQKIINYLITSNKETGNV